MCLVCGEFHSGRGDGTSAMTHSLNKGHMVWQSMTGKFKIIKIGEEQSDEWKGRGHNLHLFEWTTGG